MNFVLQVLLLWGGLFIAAFFVGKWAMGVFIRWAGRQIE